MWVKIRIAGQEKDMKTRILKNGSCKNWFYLKGNKFNGYHILTRQEASELKLDHLVIRIRNSDRAKWQLEINNAEYNSQLSEQFPKAFPVQPT